MDKIVKDGRTLEKLPDGKRPPPPSVKCHGEQLRLRFLASELASELYVDEVVDGQGYFL